MRTLLISLLVLAPSFALAAPFSDVPESHPNAEAIAHMKARGTVEGYSDGTYRPDALINRAEFTKIVIGDGFERTPEECTVSGQLYLPFSDVHQSDWFAFRLCLAVATSIISGYPDGTFRPAANINFAEAAKILAKVHVARTEEGAVWYEGAVRALASLNAIPLSITSFDQPITRGEMAEMIFRLQTGNFNKPSRTYEELGLRVAESIETGLPFSFSYPASWGDFVQVEGDSESYRSWRFSGQQASPFAAHITVEPERSGFQFRAKPCSDLDCPYDTDFDTYRSSFFHSNRITSGGVRVNQDDHYSAPGGSFHRTATFFMGDNHVTFGGSASFALYDEEYQRRVDRGLSPSITEIVLEDILWEDEHPMDTVFRLYPDKTVAEQRFFAEIDAMIGSIR